MIEAIFWDNDGVLAETEELFLQANQELLKKIGFEFDLEQYVEISLVQGLGVRELLGERGMSDAEVEAFREERNDRYSELIRAAGSVMIPGVSETIEGLSRDFRMGVVTSSRKDHFQLIHRDSAFLRHMEFILTGEDYTRFKPDPQPYRMALDRIQLPPDRCVVIEDTERGLESALAAGIRCLMLPNPLTGRRDYPRASGVLETIRDVPAAIRALAAH